MPPKKWLKRTSVSSNSGCSNFSIHNIHNSGRDLNTASPSEKLDPSIISHIFSSVSKLNWDQFEEYCGEYGSEIVVTQRWFGMNLAHVLVNRGDDDLMSSLHIRNTSSMITSNPTHRMMMDINDSQTQTTNYDSYECSSNNNEVLPIQKNIQFVNDFLCQLIKKGVDLNDEDSRNQLKPIHLCAKRCSKSFLWILTMIIEGHQKPTCMCRNGFTPLHYAISFNRLELVRDMLETSASLDFGEFIPTRFVSSYEKTKEEAMGSSQHRRVLFPIHIAAKEGHSELLKYLILHGTSTLKMNSQLFQTLLECYGLTNNAFESVCTEEESLNRFIVNMTTLDMFSMSPLMFAIKEGHTSCVQVLLSFGANPNQSDARGKSCLIYANENLLHKETIMHMLGMDNAAPYLPHAFKDDSHSFLLSCFLKPQSNQNDALENNEHETTTESSTQKEELTDNIDDNIYYI
ncbi:hypothetical protein FDP41_006832 [Naegleria fowleri]|uniref:Uncharacterized protein n=1 Tax=Naegleria fowleri TaxID=5763 RepID=A0A6A5BHE1_NAEFO|nr:uncharacterized protein FDP41_006832 [Naegleria fowleri]KAF0974222.1 hypothetical protein FDP41_006832 [Naegleria fowleri]